MVGSLGFERSSVVEHLHRRVSIPGTAEQNKTWILFFKRNTKDRTAYLRFKNNLTNKYAFIF